VTENTFAAYFDHEKKKGREWRKDDRRVKNPPHRKVLHIGKNDKCTPRMHICGEPQKTEIGVKRDSIIMYLRKGGVDPDMRPRQCPLLRRQDAARVKNSAKWSI